MGHSHSYKVQIGEQQIELLIDGEDVFIDGKKQAIVIDEVNNNAYTLILAGKTHRIFIESVAEGACTLSINGVQQTAKVQDERAQLLEQYGIADSQSSVEREVRAPMPGLVLDLLVAEDDTVEAGKGLLVLEAMKMENEIRASADGKVAKIHVAPGDAVAKGDVLLELDPA